MKEQGLLVFHIVDGMDNVIRMRDQRSPFWKQSRSMDGWMEVVSRRIREQTILTSSHAGQKTANCGKGSDRLPGVLYRRERCQVSETPEVSSAVSWLNYPDGRRGKQRHEGKPQNRNKIICLN